MSKLLEHFKRMQVQVASYLEPAQYVPFHGGPCKLDMNAAEEKARFIDDMIYMLDWPEQREAQVEAQSMADQGYPTEDAYLAACRALHWRTAELRAHGVEPVTLPQDVSHYPPDDYDFGVGPDHKVAWEELHGHLSWLQGNPRLPVQYLGRNLGEVATDLIRRAYPELGAPEVGS